MALASAIRLSTEFSAGLGLTMLNKAIASSQVFLSDASYEGLSVVSPQVRSTVPFSPSVLFDVAKVSASNQYLED